MTVISPRIVLAQCSCIGQDTLTQHVTIDTTDAAKTLITFNQFNDPSGLTYLACLTIQDTLTMVTSSMARNKSSTPVTGADFFINLSAKITGQDISASPTLGSLTYGPYDMAANGGTGPPSDSVNMGPDTIMNKKVITASPSPVTAYKGSGTISDTIQFGGGGSSDYGTSFDYSIRSKYWGAAVITFYICPSVALATAIKNFTATQNGSSILLQWTTDNEQNNTHYEIQISTGKKFVTAAEAQGDAASTGLTTKYQYQYNLDPSYVGPVYFRIKRTDASGNISYSAILTVTPGGQVPTADGISYQTYPNPVTNNVVFRFNTPHTGRYLLELVNTAGQVVQQTSVTLTGGTEIPMNLSPKPAQGLYFLKATDLTHDQHYSSKILIN